MKKSLTLKENREFRRVYSRGKSYVSPLLVTYICKSRSGACRYGITTGKKIGNAVCRNRAKRVIRAAYFELQGGIKQPCSMDIVFVARGRTVDARSTDVQKIMAEHLRMAGLL